jgi:di/tricarboxylate transporter
MYARYYSPPLETARAASLARHSRGGYPRAVTLSILIVLTVLLAAAVLFVTGWLRYDLVGLLVLLALTLTGVIAGTSALQGFANPAIITIASVLVLSGGLYRTGVANLVGRQVLRLAGDSPGRLTFLVMLTAGVLSAIMNNIATTALLLPVVLELARRIDMPPTKLLIPLAFASLLGGMMTLIGTAPNILVAGIGGESGLEPFGMFAFAPVGLTALLAGILYMTLFGRRLLPSHDTGDRRGGADLWESYGLEKTLFRVRVPGGSPLDGRPLAESRFGCALGLSAIAVQRDDHRILAPAADFVLESGDWVVVEGRSERLRALQRWQHLVRDTEEEMPALSDIVSDSVAFAEAQLSPEAEIVGATLGDVGFRSRWSVSALAVGREGALHRTQVEDVVLEAGDVLLLCGPRGRLSQLGSEPDFTIVSLVHAEEAATAYELESRLHRVRLQPGSDLVGQTLAEMRLGDAFDLSALAIVRAGGRVLLPHAHIQLQADDALLIVGRGEDLAVVDALQALVIDETTKLKLADLESRTVGFAEVTLSPRTGLVGKTLKDLLFRERYGLTVLAIWRRERSFHFNVRVRGMALEFGDAFLVYGHHSSLALLAQDPDFLVLSEEVSEAFRDSRAPLAMAIMAAVILTASLNLAPIYLAAPAGAALMVLTGCLNLDEAYGFIEWKVLILIVGMLALGVAMQETGVADLVADNVLGRASALGSMGVITGLFAISVIGAQFMPTGAVAVVMSPIALSAAADLSLSPYALLMVVAVASSCAFLSPFGHAVNLLVMGVGGYKVSDYTRVGFPLVGVLLVVVLFVLPLVWPLT